MGIDKGTARRGQSEKGHPTPHELRAFLLLSEELHFSRTARRLGLAQSSLSSAIRRLEKKLDVVLFERTSRRVELTAAGSEILPVAREVLDGLGAARSLAAAPARFGLAAFKVGIEGHGFAELTHPILSDFTARHPEVQLVMQSCLGVPQVLLDGRFDVAVLRTPLRDERFEVHVIATEPLGVIVPASHPAAEAEAASVLDFLDEPFAAFSRYPQIRDYWTGRELRGGEPAWIGGEANNALEMTWCVGELGLLTLGPESIVRALPMSGSGFVATIDLAPSRICVATRAGDRRPAVVDFVDRSRILVSELAGLAPDISPVSIG